MDNHEEYKLYCTERDKQLFDIFTTSPTRTNYKGSSTKEGSSPKAIVKRRKRNKNKKTHRR